MRRHHLPSAARVRALGAAALLAAACRTEDQRPAPGATATERAAVDTPRAAPGLPANWQRLGVGTPATAARIAEWDVDVDTLGNGLPPGHGTARDGEALYAAKCAHCHGRKGEGMMPAFPAIIGREPRDGFPFWKDPAYVRTVGNYWAYPTTIYDYLRRAMPYDRPGTLTADETYAITAYLLAANEIIPMDADLDKASLLAVTMPAHGRFVNDDRRGGPEVK